MKKQLLLISSILVLCSCNGSSHNEPKDLLHALHLASSHTIEYNIEGGNINAHGDAYFTPNGVYSKLIYEDTEMVVAYAEDEGGIFNYVLIDDKVKATSVYYGDEEGNTIHNLYSIIPSIKMIDEEYMIIDNLTQGKEKNSYILEEEKYRILIEIVGLDSSQLNIIEATLKIEQESLIFDFCDISGVRVAMEFKNINSTHIGDLEDYLANGGSYDKTSEKVQDLMSSYNYVSYLYDDKDELYAIEYYNENYYFTDYANPNEIDDGYIGVPSGSDRVSGIYHFVRNGNSVVLDEQPYDITSNQLKNVFYYPGDLNIIAGLGNLEYSVSNDAYISTDFNDTLEIAQMFGLEDYVNILYPYCSAVQFIEDKSDINRSKVGIWYIYDYGGEIGIYAKEYTDFGSSKVDFIEDYLNNL